MVGEKFHPSLTSSLLRKNISQCQVSQKTLTHFLFQEKRMCPNANELRQLGPFLAPHSSVLNPLHSISCVSFGVNKRVAAAV